MQVDSIYRGGCRKPAEEKSRTHQPTESCGIREQGDTKEVIETNVPLCCVAAHLDNFDKLAFSQS